MKNPPFRYLLYREFVSMKKHLLLPSMLTGIGLLICTLLQLSLSMGNLKLLAGEDSVISYGIELAMVLFPAILFSAFSDSVVDASFLDVEERFTKFRLSLPVSPTRFAVAKYSVVLGELALTAMLYTLYLCVLNLTENHCVTEHNIKLGMIFFMIFTVMELIMQVAVMHFRSKDKAGIATMIFMAIVTLGLCNSMVFKKLDNIGNIDMSRFEGEVSEEIFLYFTEDIVALFPVIAAIAVAVLVICFIVTVLIFKRREK